MIDSLFAVVDTGVAGAEIALQNNPADGTAFECFVDAETSMVDCGIQEYQLVTGDALFGLIIGGVILLSLYIASDGDLVVPSVVTTLIGGGLIPMLPGSYQTMAIVIMFLGLIGGVFAVTVKYVARGGY